MHRNTIRWVGAVSYFTKPNAKRHHLKIKLCVITSEDTKQREAQHALWTCLTKLRCTKAPFAERALHNQLIKLEGWEQHSPSGLCTILAKPKCWHPHLAKLKCIEMKEPLTEWTLHNAYWSHNAENAKWHQLLAGFASLPHKVKMPTDTTTNRLLSYHFSKQRYRVVPTSQYTLIHHLTNPKCWVIQTTKRLCMSPRKTNDQ